MRGNEKHYCFGERNVNSPKEMVEAILHLTTKSSWNSLNLLVPEPWAAGTGQFVHSTKSCCDAGFLGWTQDLEFAAYLM